MSTLKVDTIQSYSGGDVTTSGNQVNSGNVTVSNGNIVQDRPDTAQANNSQNANYFSSFWGSNRYWKSVENEAGLTIGALNKAQLSLNAFTADFSTDNLINIESRLVGGTFFDDWSGNWMNVPENGTPIMKRGLTIEGLGNYADDTAAAAGGVPVNGLYRNGNVVQIRIV